MLDVNSRNANSICIDNFCRGIETPEMKIEGYVEGIQGGFLRGWVRDPSDDNNVISLDVFLCNERLATLNADIYRKDLEAAGMGAGKHGFEFKVQENVLEAGDYLVVKLHGMEQQIMSLGKYNPPDLQTPRISEAKNPNIRLRRVIRKYIHGTGIEIGALHNPLPVPDDADVRYVDRMSSEDLRKHYPEMNNKSVVPVHHLCDGESLECIGDGIYDFVIANNVLEHTENPIWAVENMLRVLKEGGIVYLTIPDKRGTFDRHRPLTSFEHLLKDYNDGPAVSREGHFQEWARFVSNKSTQSEIDSTAKDLMERAYSIHFHVWRRKEMSDMFNAMREELGLPFVIEKKMFARHEGIFILRKV